MSDHDRRGPPSHDAAQGSTRDVARDAALKRAWQQASDEQPPPGLDAAIIAAARKSVQDRGADSTTIHASAKSRHRWMQWQPLAAAATVAGLAFVLAQLMPRDREVAPPIRIEEPATRPATAEDKAGAASPAASAPQAVAEELAGADAPSAPAPQPKAETPGYDYSARPKAHEAPVAAETADAAVTARGTTAMNSIEADQPGPAAPLSATDWAASIAALYASGDTTGAADALRAFRAALPNADKYLPDSLRDWAKTVE